MKKIFLAMAALVCSMSMSAQVINIYKDGNIVKTYTASEADSVVFAEAQTHEYVDLGLPSGTLWATCNVGANKPEEYGLYFAWGETTGYGVEGIGSSAMVTDSHSFTWGNYSWCNGSSTTLTKYCTSSDSGTTDNKTELESTDDAATAIWGSDWQMPSKEQIKELCNSDYTTTEWTTENEVYGCKITSKTNGNSIFLPAAGSRGDVISSAGSNGLYWSRELISSDHPDGAGFLFFDSGYQYLGGSYRCSGFSVRAVRVQTPATDHEYVDLSLPSGTLWATCNVGAENPEEYGLYFAWGETTGYNTNDGHSFDWTNYCWCSGSRESMTKYCTFSSYGTVDGKTELESSDDAATVNWGSDWQMPSKEQIDELCNSNYTTTEWTIENGVYGRKITSKTNSKSVFFPAAGCWFITSLSDAGAYGFYLSRSLYSESSDEVYSLNFNSSGQKVSSSARCVGFPVRAVRVQE